MKIFKTLMITAVGMLLSTSCNASSDNKTANDAASEPAKESTVSAKEGKALIIYFSHAGENYAVGNIEVGNTKIIADYIKEYTGADQFEVVAEKSYDMSYNELIKVAQEEQRKGEKPAFKGSVNNMDDYDTVFIGTPIWWGTFPQVMFTFFDKYDLNGKTIIPFTTHEGSGLGSVVNDLKKLYPNASFEKALATKGTEARTGKDRVIKWLTELGF
ncbi:MAG: NAD(P)H-dependent oxidoreductase [Bacteroidaceae bacterium]|nr:NAD(P)H-dependent oxidoreductase [Bacteroidaceae bacterium]